MLATMTRSRSRPGPDPVPVEIRFWDKVDTSGGPDACHPWTRYCNPAGYGKVGTSPRVVELAHRVAWQLTHPGDPMPPVVRHKCDNPPCCNPDHLEGGTVADNNRDREERGRSADRRGENGPRAILTELDVREIARLRAAGMTYSEVATATGATRSQVADVVTGRSWSHLDLPIVARRYRPRVSS